MPERGSRRLPDDSSRNKPDAPLTLIGNDERGAAFARQVRDALAHLYDPIYLQNHPLTRLVPPEPGARSPGVGRALRQLLVDAIEALHPLTGAGANPGSGTSYQILQLRYVEGLDVPAVQARLALGRSEYYREQQRGLEAVVSLLWDRGHEGLGDTDRNPTVALVPTADVARPTAPSNNLPAPITSYIARAGELTRVEVLLRESRLLTITGTGGCGKTRLALEVARAVAGEYADGVWLVELAALADPGRVPDVVAAALGVRGRPGQPIQVTLLSFLRGRRLLLILDNCEHLLDACARLIDALLRGCPDLRILATSRAAIGVTGEVSWRAPSLALPPVNQETSLAAVASCEAIRLFVDRAMAVQPALTLTLENAPSVAQICRRLDGIPLAIELAATRVKSLSLGQIAARLDDRFRLLTVGSRTALPRQQTLRALVDWSVDRLAESERTLLRRLAVFVGGWTLEAAERICATNGIKADEVLELLTSLVDKSLVIAEERDGQARFRMLETIRQYAAEMLLAAGEAAVIRDRHRDWYLELAERAEPELIRSDQVIWFRRIEAEYDNLQAALGWSKADEAGAEIELRLAGALGRYWYMERHGSEGREWLEHALARADRRPSRPRSRALNWAGRLMATHGDLARAKALTEEAVAVARDVGDLPLLAIALRHLSIWDQATGDATAAREHLAAALGAARQGGDQRETAYALAIVAVDAFNQGDLGGARQNLDSALPLARRSGDRTTIGVVLFMLAILESQQGNFRRGRALIDEVLAMNAQTGLQNVIVDSQAVLAHLLFLEGDVTGARGLIRQLLLVARDDGERDTMVEVLPVFAALRATEGAAATAARILGALDAAPLDAWAWTAYYQIVRSRYEQALAAARAALGPEAFAAAWAEGQGMTLEEAVAYTLGDISRFSSEDWSARVHPQQDPSP